MEATLSEQKVSKEEVIAQSVAKLSDSKGLEAIGYGIGWGITALAGAAVFLALALSSAASKWDGHLQQQAKCFELKEIS